MLDEAAHIAGHPFFGAKAALILGHEIPVILRDDRADIPYPDHWDLPGGGREGSESPLDCALRETREELGIEVGAGLVHWGRPFFDEQGREVWFFVASLPPERVADITLGDEGQRWQMMHLQTYMAHPRGIPAFQQRLGIYLSL